MKWWSYVIRCGDKIVNVNERKVALDNMWKWKQNAKLFLTKATTDGMIYELLLRTAGTLITEQWDNLEKIPKREQFNRIVDFQEDGLKRLSANSLLKTDTNKQ